MKLEKLLFHQLRFGRREARRVISAGQVTVEDAVELNPLAQVDEFTKVLFNGGIVQNTERRCLMVHKPVGYVSEVGHHTHPTVLDLLPEKMRGNMHYAGRLDLSTSGLMIVTNDGIWSRRMTLPNKEVPKIYRVQLERDIDPATSGIFTRGIYFGYEDITTRPAKLEIIDQRNVRLTIHEGKYHQVKRMFHAVGNRVVALHRERVGEIVLDIEEGQWRDLQPQEVDWVK